jgi:conjugal transfer/entry exclusion protein
MKRGETMQISNTQASQLQAVQKLQPPNARAEGSKTEEANESASERAAEAQKKAVAQSTGVGSSLDTKI